MLINEQWIFENNFQFYLAMGTASLLLTYPKYGDKKGYAQKSAQRNFKNTMHTKW